RRGPSCHEATFQSHLCSLALANVLFQRDCFILHGSAVQLKDGAVVFIGDSGAGKTTLTAGLLRKNYPVLTEDATVIQIIDGVAHVLPGLPYMKLGQKTVDLLGWNWEQLPPLYATVDRRAVLMEPQYLKDPVPLQAINVLETSEEKPLITWQEISSLEAKFSCLATHVHYQSFFVSYPLNESYSDMAIRLAEQIPFHQITRPAGKNTIEDMLYMIVNNFNTLSLYTA
ncbi:MAG: hypothetical protein AAFP19_25090, partial [Bacteroidota bacterium]